MKYLTASDKGDDDNESNLTYLYKCKNLTTRKGDTDIQIANDAFLKPSKVLRKIKIR